MLHKCDGVILGVLYFCRVSSTTGDTILWTSQEWVPYFRLCVHVQYYFKMGLGKERLI